MILPPPPLVDIDKAIKYKVKEIFHSHIRNGELEYLIYWHGYNNSEETWEPHPTLLTHHRKSRNSIDNIFVSQRYIVNRMSCFMLYR